MKHFRLVSTYFVAGFTTSRILDQDVIIVAAPIIRWTIGKTLNENLRAYFTKKRWKLEEEPT